MIDTRDIKNDRLTYIDYHDICHRILHRILLSQDVFFNLLKEEVTG